MPYNMAGQPSTVNMINIYNKQCVNCTYEKLREPEPAIES